jgi:hypothetical protein
MDTDTRHDRIMSRLGFGSSTATALSMEGQPNCEMRRRSAITKLPEALAQIHTNLAITPCWEQALILADRADALCGGKFTLLNVYRACSAAVWDALGRLYGVDEAGAKEYPPYEPLPSTRLGARNSNYVCPVAGGALIWVHQRLTDGRWGDMTSDSLTTFDTLEEVVCHILTQRAAMWHWRPATSEAAQPALAPPAVTPSSGAPAHCVDAAKLLALLECAYKAECEKTEHIAGRNRLAHFSGLSQKQCDEHTVAIARTEMARELLRSARSYTK